MASGVDIDGGDVTGGAGEVRDHRRVARTAERSIIAR
jgi:hypothetical protein